MKQFIFFMLLGTFSIAGFFNESTNKDKVEYLENERLCNLFIQKVKDYKKTMRSDFLATATLASYEHRASLFCKKAKTVKENLSSDILEDLNISDDTNNSIELNITAEKNSTNLL